MQFLLASSHQRSAITPLSTMLHKTSKGQDWRGWAAASMDQDGHSNVVVKSAKNTFESCISNRNRIERINDAYHWMCVYAAKVGLVKRENRSVGSKVEWQVIVESSSPNQNSRSTHTSDYMQIHTATLCFDRELGETSTNGILIHSCDVGQHGTPPFLLDPITRTCTLIILPPFLSLSCKWQRDHVVFLTYCTLSLYWIWYHESPFHP